MNPVVLLQLIADLYNDVLHLKAENAALRAALDQQQAAAQEAAEPDLFVAEARP